MKKKIVLITSMMMMTLSFHAQSFETATQAVKNMRVGWNLGNTLDANNNNGSKQGLNSEICWGQPYTKPALMKMMKDAGFGVIRVPVTWFPHMDSSNKVDEAWMKRVHEVVDYVINNGMYCILNVHHDTGKGSFHWLHASMDTYNNTKEKYEYLWKQIAEEFKDYDEHLIFEAYNEMLDKYDSWCFSTFGRTGGYNATDAADAYEAINNYAQSFVDVVRATGGNNAQRNLVINTYGSCNGGGTWNPHLKDPLKELKYPNDEAGAGHIIFQVHAYPAIVNDDGSNHSVKSIRDDIKAMIEGLKTHLVSKGGPVIVGEWGTSNVDANPNDYDAHRALMLKFAEIFVQECKDNDIGTIYWMGLSNGSHRSVPEFNQPDLKDAIIKGYYGEEGYSSVSPLIYKPSSDAPIFDLQGRRLTNPRKGIYIQNRKKVVIK